MPRLQGRKPAPLGTQDVRVERPVKLPPNQRFLLMAHPHQWTVIDGQVVPYLQRLSRAPGVSKVGRRGELHAALEYKRRRGWIEIPENVRNPDDPNETYLRVHDGEKGEVWTTEWEIVYPGSKVIKTDRKAYVAFLRDLMDRGIIPTPEPHILEEMLARMTSIHRELLDKAATVPSAAPAARRMKDQIEAVERELARVTGTAPADDAAVEAKRSAGRKPSRGADD